MGRARLSSRHPVDEGVHAALLKRRWTITEARVVVEAHGRSGLSLAAFARRHRVSLQRLYDWRRRLDVDVAPRFLPVTVKATPAPIAPTVGTGLEIVLRGGRTVRVGSGCDERLLARVVEVLEGLPC